LQVSLAAELLKPFSNWLVDTWCLPDHQT
jgi:hypothetical protein